MKYIRILVLFALTGLLLNTFLSGSATFADALRGLEIAFQFDEGAAFNTLNYPSVTDPSFHYYISWWAPGQWILPYSFMQFTGIQDLQSIQFILISLALILSITGYFRLFKKYFGESSITWLSLLTIITHPLFYWQSFMYTGGDLLLLAITPWFILFLSERSEKATSRDLLFFICFGIIGIFLKTSFLLVLASSGIYLFLRGSGTIIQRVNRTWMYAIAAVGLLFITKTLFIGNGETPGTAIDVEGYYGIPNTLSNDLSTSIGSIIGGLFHLTKFSQQLEAANGASTAISELLKWGALLGSCLFLILWKKGPKDYSNILLFFAFVFLISFIPFYVMDRAISYELRHFAPVLFLFIPALIHGSLQYIKKSIVYLSLLVFIGFNVYLYRLDHQFMNTDTTFYRSLKLTRTEATPYQILGEWDENEDNALCLIEDYWAPSVAIRRNDKLVLTENEKGLCVVSGMELNNPDRLNAQTFEDYENIMIIGKIGNATDLFKFTNRLELISAGEKDGFEWKEFKRTTNAKTGRTEKRR